MKIKNNDFYNFLCITKDILLDEEFINLKNEYHHGNTNRYDHSVRVALNVYKFCKNKNVDVVSVTRGALLHDFFIRSEIDGSMHDELTIHPRIAVSNAKLKFNINKLEEDIIRTHMFPITKERPKNLESLIVSIVDKQVSLKEGCKYNLLKRRLKVIEINDIDLSKEKLKEKEVLNLTNYKEEFNKLLEVVS